MKYSEAKQGRVFVIRLENGDVVHEELERFAREHNIKAASLIILGGADSGSMLIVGPEDGRSAASAPMTTVLQNVHEIAGVGTIFPNEEGEPVLHCHIACGRKNTALTGCIRAGVQVWHVMEVILYELVDSSAVRKLDPASSFHLLQA
jgi:predicted DNA-binding protein with PD1-like motif